MSIISDTEIATLTLSQPVPLNAHPASVYLGSLSYGSQRTMRSSLNAIARLLTDNRCDAMTLDWSKLRYRHRPSVEGTGNRERATVKIFGEMGKLLSVFSTNQRVRSPAPLGRLPWAGLNEIPVQCLYCCLLPVPYCL